MHINGNGLWATRREFQAFAKRVHDEKLSQYGFDTDMFEYMWNRQHQLRDYLHMFRFSKFSINMNNVQYKPSEILEYFPETFLVHGKYRLEEQGWPLVFEP